MANASFDEIFRRALDLNLRYYSAVGKLAADYMRDLVNVMSEAQLAPGTAPKTGTGGAPGARAGAAQLVLESAAGETALGVFLVANSLPQEVKASVVASAFTDSAGRQFTPKIVFDPPVVSLRPGEQLLVRAQCEITAEIEPDTRFYGEFLIPALQGTRVPVVLRRRPTS